MTDPTTNNDAVGYLLHQASQSFPNGREVALTEKCAEYLRWVIADHKRLSTRSQSGDDE